MRCASNRSISLANNAFSGSLPDALTTLTKVSAVDITNNKFSGSLPSGLSLLGGLSTLRVSMNDIVGSIPTTVTLLTKLRCVERQVGLLTPRVDVVD